VSDCTTNPVKQGEKRNNDVGHRRIIHHDLPAASRKYYDQCDCEARTDINAEMRAHAGAGELAVQNDPEEGHENDFARAWEHTGCLCDVKCLCADVKC